MSRVPKECNNEWIENKPEENLLRAKKFDRLINKSKGVKNETKPI